MNRIDRLFQNKKDNVLSIFFTAGFPELEDTVEILKSLQEQNVDMVEIGIPFSDPLADGPIIQHSSHVALKNGMSLEELFKQLKHVRNEIHFPLLLMGYYNTILQFGVDRFIEHAADIGIDGVIVPDIPLEEWEEIYAYKFRSKNIHPVLLITAQTPEERIQRIDRVGSGFIYVVASSGITGRQNHSQTENDLYLSRIKKLGLKNPIMAGFGVHNRETFRNACAHMNGAIIGSAFIDALKESQFKENNITNFLTNIL
ncbi:MAG: tryptophan synthase subunit alpha [Bacteroidota bacterium]